MHIDSSTMYSLCSLLDIMQYKPIIYSCTKYPKYILWNLFTVRKPAANISFGSRLLDI